MAESRTVADAGAGADGQAGRALGVRVRRAGGAVLRYALLLTVAAVIADAGRVCRDRRVQGRAPAGGQSGRACPTRGSRPTTPTRSRRASFWIQLRNSAVVAALSTVVVVLFAALAAFVFARREFPGREVAYTLFTLGPAVPVGGRDPAAVHPRPRPRAARQPARARPAAGGVRAAADDHHPAAVLPEHPRRAGGRRRDRRLRARSASSGGSCCRCPGRRWSPSRSSPSSPAGTSSCCRW